MTSTIEIKNLKRKDGDNKKIDLKGGTVLDGLPSSTGLVNAIASECLIRSTGTDLVAFLDSPDFPPLSVVTNYIPQYPIRIYVNENLKVAFFVSDISIDKLLQREVANAILKWTRENECKLIISAQGIQSSSYPPSHDDNGRNDNSRNAGAASKSNPNDPSESATPSPFPTNSYAVTSTESATRFIIGQSNYFSHLRSGTITGIPAILLNEGALTNLDVIVFLVNALPDVPDFRAAAIVSEAVSKIIPNLSCDIGALMIEAQLIEDRMKNVRDEHNRTSYIA
ncbi:MAG: PAC2 family protein [Nitrososphaeraceae archaeon]